MADGRILLGFVTGTERKPVHHFPVKERADALILDRDAAKP